MGTFLSEKKVVTRKSRICHGCGRGYPAKTEMIYNAGIFEGEFSAVYFCKTCDEFMETLSGDDRSEGFYEGDLLNYDNHPFNLEKK
jgi:hypothetical protein